MLFPVEIDDIWTYPKTGTRYRVIGLPTVRNYMHDHEAEYWGYTDLQKWVPGVCYVTIDPKDPKGQGDNQEFTRHRQDFQENFQKENILKKAELSPLPEGTCLKCGGEGYIEMWNEVGKCGDCVDGVAK
jgi:hypothetical protein